MLDFSRCKVSFCSRNVYVRRSNSRLFLKKWFTLQSQVIREWKLKPVLSCTRSSQPLILWVFERISSAASTPMGSKSHLLSNSEQSSQFSRVVMLLPKLSLVQERLLLFQSPFCSPSTSLLERLRYVCPNTIFLTLSLYFILTVQVLILSPTRELAVQIQKVILALGDYLGTQVRKSLPSKWKTLKIYVNHYFCCSAMLALEEQTSVKTSES